MQQDTDIFAFF